MKVLVDTSIWSLVLRRKQEDLNELEKIIFNEIIELISESRVVIIGPIRQEILSGISSQKQFNLLKSKLKNFEDLQIKRTDYEKAAEFHNTCRRNGIQGSHIDFLICAVAYQNGLSIFTTDKDFIAYQKYLNFGLFKVRNT